MSVHRVYDPAVKAVIESYPQNIRLPLEELRSIVFDTARAIPGIGPLVECLKWGQPAYRPFRPRTGTTVRIGPAHGEDEYALYVPCQTSLILDFRRLYGDRLRLEGSRAVVFTAGDVLPVGPLTHCIALALTYHERPGLADGARVAKRSPRRTEAVTSA